MNGHPMLKRQFEHGYWATDRVLAQAALLPDAEFASTRGSPRNLRETLVHALDTEWSWRLRLQGAPAEVWEVEMKPDDFPTVSVLAERWRLDRTEMMSWIDSLTEVDISVPPPQGFDTPRPLWYYLVHINHHSGLARADAAFILTEFGRSPGDLDFLDFIDENTSTSHPA